MTKKKEIANAVQLGGMSAKERQILQNVRANAETEEFKRPDHADFATREELAARKFNGQRINGINKDWELWLHGRVVKVVPESTYCTNPEAIPLAYASVFEMHEDLMEVKGC